MPHCSTSLPPITPDPSAPQRLADEVRACLAPLPFVRTISLFGSLAEGRGDAWSDVDMLVACEDVGETRWLAAAALRAAKPVLYYRTFSTAEQPSGRYWFENESPLNKLDISFHSVREHEECYRTSARLGHGVTLREIHANPTALARAPEGLRPWQPLDITPREEEIGVWIRRVVDGLRYTLRGKMPLPEFRHRLAGLRTAMAGLTPQSTMAGGQIGRLGHELLDWASSVSRSDSKL